MYSLSFSVVGHVESAIFSFRCLVRANCLNRGRAVNFGTFYLRPSNSAQVISAGACECGSFAGRFLAGDLVFGIFSRLSNSSGNEVGASPIGDTGSAVLGASNNLRERQDSQKQQQ
jgi:hypothetical protein